MLILALRRILSAVTLAIVVPAIVFVLLHSSTAAVARNLLGASATAAQVAQKTVELGLDRPLAVQYAQWFGHAMTGDLGTSWFTNEPVLSLLATYLPATVSIVIVTVMITAVISITLGIAAAVRGGLLNRLIQITSVVGFAVPTFWIAFLLVIGFSLSVPLLPATGYVALTQSPIGWVSSLVLPVTALVIGAVAASAQQVRGAMLDVLSQDYIRTLRARGLSETSVLYRHALRNAAGPTLTVLSLQFISLFGGAVVIEKVFAIAGMGTLTVNAAVRADVPVLMAVVTVMAIMIAITNFAADVVAVWINPRAQAQ